MTAQSASEEGRSNPWLDLVRALAIVLVLLRHGERALQAKAAGLEGLLHTVFLNGWIGVDLFFVLSGYLIARHLFRAGIGSAEFGFGRYVAMRALRILPAYYAVLVLTAAGAFPLFHVSGEALALRFAYHVLFLQDYLPSDINAVFWSLGVEEKFYLLAPLLILLLLRCRGAGMRIALLLSLCALPMLARTAIFHLDADGVDYPEFWRTFRSPFHMALEGLVVGVAIALAQHAGAVRPSRKTGLCVLAGSALVLLVWAGSHEFMAELSTADVTLQPALIALLAGAITLGGVQLDGTPMPLARPVRAVARLSYSLYLIHYPLIPLVIAVALPHGPAVFWCLYLAASLCAALLLHFAVERPFLVWKSQIARRTRPAAPISALAMGRP
jgi:peptidoglycan/LPS O-acetylase OafA/YrhL